MYHGAGFVFTYMAPWLGGTCYVLDGFFLAMLASSRTESVFLVPTHAHHIRRVCENPMEKYDFSAL